MTFFNSARKPQDEIRGKHAKPNGRGASGVENYAARTVRTSYVGATHSRGSVTMSKTYRQAVPVVALAVVLALVAVGGVAAWMWKSGALTNTFGIGEVAPTVEETLTNGTTENAAEKSNVKVSLPLTSVTSYVRAQVDVYWVDADGNRMWEEPTAGTDYSLTLADMGSAGIASEWFLGSDGYYYWTSPVAAGGSTDALVTLAKQLNTYEDGRQLSVDIVSQAVQADPVTAAQEAWGVTMNADGVISGLTTTGGN